MHEFLLKIILAHVLGDFLFQPTAWVKAKEVKKQKSPYLYAHIGVHLVCLIVCLRFDFQYITGMFFILTSHFVIDLAKLHLATSKNKRLLFFADQTAHLIVIALVVRSYFGFTIDIETLFSAKWLLTILFLILTTVVGSVLIKLLTSVWTLDWVKQDDSLENAGSYIGILERLFIFVFLILNHWEGIGFLLAAKSIFRFGDLTKSSDRKLTEYILIGTLLSFGYAIGCGLAFQYLLATLK
jgi:Protein of unknown function (DUF3307)